MTVIKLQSFLSKENNKPSFLKYLKNLKKQYIIDMEMDGLNAMLFSRYKMVIRHFNPSHWSKISNFYFCHESNFFSLNEKLSFLIVLDILKDNIFSYNAEVIWNIVEALVRQQVNPYLYEKYLNIFLHEAIYPHLKRVIDQHKDKLLYTYLEEFITKTDAYSLDHFDYGSLMHPILELTKGEFSPILHGDYRFTNISFHLEDIMLAEKLSFMHFTNQDFRIVQTLPLFVCDLTEIEQDELILRIQEIEEKYGTRNLDFAKQCVVVLHEFALLAQMEEEITRKRIR